MKPNDDDNGNLNGEELEASGAGSAGAEPEAVPDAPRTMRQRVKRLLVSLVFILFFLLILLIGLMVMFYPNISEFVNSKNQSRVIEGYTEAVARFTQEDYDKAFAAANAYNAKLAGTGATVTDAFSEGAEDVSREDEYWTLLNLLGNGIMGYVEIEAADIRLPLYHGVSEAVLAVGVGHIQGSSLPVGGEGTHAVVSAHTGLPSARLFTGVDQLKNGDTFQLFILNEILTYEVDQVLTVLPHEIEALGIEKGNDCVTLVTCTPYGINSHRLLIRGTRVETPEQESVITEISDEPEIEEPGWFQKLTDNAVAFFSFIIEEVAGALVGITEWAMDLFGVEY